MNGFWFHGVQGELGGALDGGVGVLEGFGGRGTVVDADEGVDDGVFEEAVGPASERVEEGGDRG